MKFPFILFFRYDKYKSIDIFLQDNCNKLNCTLHIINKKEKLNKLFKQTYPLLVVFGEKDDYKDDLSELHNSNMSNRIIYISSIDNINAFNETVNKFYINMCSLERVSTRPVFSIFTTTFNSFDKILRAFKSIQSQTLTNWEWVIVDDSPDDKNFQYLKQQLLTDNRVRIYKRFENNGYIGNVKNESVSLCRGQYVLELDHDDEILPFVLEESVALFTEKPEVGFIYMDFINIYENGDNFFYGDFICKGYGSYYCQKYNDKWVYVYVTPNINNITLSHLVCCPNHPRIWRRDLLLSIGNYCEYLPICDDYEIILRTALNTKIAKIHKFGYIQYMNNENNNFSLIRNAEINRIGPNYIKNLYYDKFDIHNEMKKLNAYEDEKYISEHSVNWKRDPTTYSHNYCNLLVNSEYETQFCIIGLDGLLKNRDRITELYKDNKNDFIVIENKCSIEYLWKKLDALGFEKMKCYSLMDETEERLINYFRLCYLSTNKYEIFTANITKLKYNTTIVDKHKIINDFTKNTDKYLEIGIEYGDTFSNAHFLHKVGLDPDPKFDKNIAGSEIFKCTSDSYFKNITDNVNQCNFDVVFIDGMHRCENVLRDFNNSINKLTKDGFIFIGDCIPLNYNEQLKTPIKHFYEKGILKYGEEWTGDVWKFLYHLLKNYKDKINLQYFHNINYRGMFMLQIKDKFTVDVSYEELNSYDYFEHFNDYSGLLSTLK
jgi:glycosyltransferase involved in cell wall biosynthesis